ncbi:MAG: PhzF family phenazine biosynthesis protein [Planctomycetota bacterium]
MAPVPILQVDAFTSEPFRGNPAAVCILSEPRQDAWMQAVAAEMNLSETAFLLREGDGWRLRWFTPTVEVDLCGHATLASAHVLLEQDGEVRFLTKSGTLSARRSGGWIELDFPSLPAEPATEPVGLVEALGAVPVCVGKSRFDFIVELESEEAVRALRVDVARLRKVEARGVIVTSRGREYDFVSRFFAPRAGVDEDPVTGSAHCCLAPYWSELLGKTEMTGYQASARGGVVQVRLSGDRVILRGQAVTVLRGELSPAT